MKSLNLMSFPFHYGQPHHGVANAGHYLRREGIIERLRKSVRVRDFGEIALHQIKTNKFDQGIIDPRQNFQANHLIARTISRALPADLQLNIGGDHGMGLATVSAALERNPDTVIIWADAHGDINTPSTSPSGNFHGMPLAYLLGEATHPDFHSNVRLSPNHLILIGPRDLDHGERDIIQRKGIQYFSSEELNRVGAKDILEMALHRADPLGTSPIHLSFDVDLFDANDMISTGTKVSQGPRLEEVFLLGGLLAETDRLSSLDIVEFNPALGSPEDAASSATLILDFLDVIVKQLAVNETRPSYLSKELLSQLITTACL